MPSPFSTLQNSVFTTVKSTFAYPCSWTSADGAYSFEGTVLFNQPTMKDELGGLTFDPFNFYMEYPDTDFLNLKELVDEAQTNEVVTIDGKCYQVMAVIALYDGKTFRATLQILNDEDL